MKKAITVILCVLDIVASLPWKTHVDNLSDIRIIGGHEVEISKAPYQVALLLNYRQFCGGSIITKKHILTTASCVEYCNYTEKPGNFTIRAGSNDWTSGGVVVRVVVSTKHPKFSERPIDYDIAILELSEPLNFTEYIAPIQLADESYVVNDGDSMEISGWGQKGGEFPVHLQGDKTQKINFDQCKQSYRRHLMKLSPRFICALHPDGGHNSCDGDEGSPLIHNKTQVGMYSFGGPCITTDPKWFLYMPTAYTKVAKFSEWIKSIIA